MSIFCLWCCRRKTNQRESLPCPPEYIKILKQTTNLKTGQINHLYKCFCTIGKDADEYPPQHLKKKSFLTLASLQRNPILSMLLTSMFGDKKVLKFIDFAKFLSIFQANTLSTKREQLEEAKKRKLKLLFNMYDIDKNGIITQADLINVVHKLFSDIWNTQQIFNVATTIMYEMDTSHTNQILFEDFCSAFDIFDMEESLVTKLPSDGRIL